MTRYSVDDKNRLIVLRNEGVLVAHGAFHIDAANRLVFTVREPTAWRRLNGLPGQIIFEGAWRLDENHDLVLVLAKTARRIGSSAGELRLKGTLISAHCDALIFEIVSYDRDGLLQARLLKLSVLWFADSANRLCFTVKRLDESLVLESQWHLNKNNQITYSYEKIDPLRKAKVRKELVFEGYWQLGDSRKVTYCLGSSPESKFEFRAQIETPTIYPQQGVIKYRLGLGLRKARATRQRTVCLYGVWKISRTLRLSFTMDYDSSGAVTYEFASDVLFSKRNTVTFVLKNARSEPLGIQVKFTHVFIKRFDGDIFLRLQAMRSQYAAYAGMRVAF